MDSSLQARSALFPGVIFGVHAGLQNTNPLELQAAWRHIETLGFDWISVFDHLYSANGTGDTDCLESVSTHTLLAATTRHVTCGSLVYVPSYRHPAILAKAMASIDLLSQGRAVIGLGAGWHRREYRSFGLNFLERRDRLRQLEEAYDCIDLLLNNGSQPATYEGKFFRLEDAYCTPVPVQERLPIWIGGGGEKVTLRLAARADGWNVPFVAPEVFTHKKQILANHCEAQNRSVNDVTCSVNIGVAWSDADLREQFGRNAEQISSAVLQGSVERMRELVRAYVDAGAEQINIAIRPRKGAGHQLDEFTRVAEMLQLTGRRVEA